MVEKSLFCAGNGEIWVSVIAHLPACLLHGPNKKGNCHQWVVVIISDPRLIFLFEKEHLRMSA